MTDNPLIFTANLDRYQLPAGRGNTELSCHVNVKPDVFTRDGMDKATTASICLVFDCSLSMTGKKFTAAIETAKLIVDILHERHYLSLVAFQSKSHIVFKNAVPKESEKDFIKKEIDRLKSHLGGSTNMSAGIESAMDVLSGTKADANVIVLLSDGVPDFVDEAQMAANEASQKGIQIYAVGIGGSYDADQLLRLVTPSNGAVFGDSEVKKINDIFSDIVDRIDRIFATNVKLNFIFDKGVQLKQVFKTSPERALYDSAAIDSNDNNLELRVGNIEDNKVYEFLLQIEVGRHDVGFVELIRVQIQYDINYLGKHNHSQEIILVVNYSESSTPQSATDKTIGNAMRSATMVQLCDELVQACTDSDNDLALQAITTLKKRCDEENNTALQQHLDNMQNQLVQGYKISDKDRNDFLLASTIAPDEDEQSDQILTDLGSDVPEKDEHNNQILSDSGSDVAEEDEHNDLILTDSISDVPDEKEHNDLVFVYPDSEAPGKNEHDEIDLSDLSSNAIGKDEIYDLILTDPGSDTIRLLREIRNATSMGLRDIAVIIRRKNSVVTAFKNRGSAERLQQRLIDIGAKVKVNTREVASKDK